MKQGQIQGPAKQSATFNAAQEGRRIVHRIRTWTCSLFSRRQKRKPNIGMLHLQDPGCLGWRVALKRPSCAVPESVSKLNSSSTPGSASGEAGAQQTTQCRGLPNPALDPHLSLLLVSPSGSRPQSESEVLVSVQTLDIPLVSQQLASQPGRFR